MTDTAFAIQQLAREVSHLADTVFFGVMWVALAIVANGMLRK